MADLAVGLALYQRFGGMRRMATVEMKINYLRPISSGKLIARSHLVRVGELEQEAERLAPDEVLPAQLLASPPPADTHQEAREELADQVGVVGPTGGGCRGSHRSHPDADVGSVEEDAVPIHAREIQLIGVEHRELEQVPGQVDDLETVHRLAEGERDLGRVG